MSDSVRRFPCFERERSAVVTEDLAEVPSPSVANVVYQVDIAVSVRDS
jgi:hypothetical protein